MPAKIITLTLNPSIDKSSETEQILPDKKLRCHPPVFEPGGGGINVSRAIQKLGGQSLAYYPQGGTSGMFFTELMERHGIASKGFEVESYTRENFTITETSTNRLYRFGMPGDMLKEWEIFLNPELYKDADYVVASGSLPPGVPGDFYVRLAELLKDSGTRYILDTSGPALSAALKTGAYLLKPNLAELNELVGHELEDITKQEAVAIELVKKHPIEVLVVSLGPAGALVATATEAFTVPAPAVPYKSSVGAGDSMVGGMVHALSQNKTLKEAAMWGVACGSAAIKTPGTELFKAEEAIELFKYMKDRQGTVI